MTTKKQRKASTIRKTDSRRRISQRCSALVDKISAMTQAEERALASSGIATLEDLRDADLDFVVERIPKLEHAMVQRWQQMALLQTVFVGLGRKQSRILVDAGITTIPAMAQIDLSQLKKVIQANNLAAWKFIASRIAANILPERLETAQEVEPLTPPQAVALYAQGIQTLRNLREINSSQLDFDLLTGIRKQDLELWKYLAGLRLDYGIGPAYAYQLYLRYTGDKDKIDRHIQRERNKALAEISRKPRVRTRGSSAPLPENETLAKFYLEPLSHGLAEAVTNSDKQKINQALRGAKQWGSASEISGRLLQSVADDPTLDKSAVISWITENKLSSRRGMLDLVSGVVRDKNSKQELLKTLADQFGLGAVLSDISKSTNKDSVLGLVTQAVKNWQDLVVELPKVKEDAPQIVEQLLGDLKIKPAAMISAVLQSEKGQKESILQTLLNCLQEKQSLDKEATLLELYKEKADFIQPFLQSLHQLGMAAWYKLDDLLEIPLKAFSNESAKDRDGMFASIFRALGSISAETEQDFDAMMSGLTNWVRKTNQQESVPLLGEGLNPGAEVGIPLGVHLLGAGLRSYVGNYYENRPAADRFVDKLLDHLPLENGLEEEIWLHLCKVPGMLFTLFPKMLLKAITTPMKVFQWIGQDANNIRQKDRKLEILTLPLPDQEHKYVIISDVHRDAPEDVVDEHFFDLSHFSKNCDLFITALEYYLHNGYTVIENGDCEELWVVPSVKHNRGVRARAERIIASDGPHRRVYELLAELHRQGRYFRTRGNHDDFWAQSSENMNLLKGTWFREGPYEFKVWDALIIPNVLTMYDDYLGVMGRIMKAKREGRPIAVEELVDLFPVGLSPHRYRDRTPLFIMHGHQTDFWNCDEHNFLGKIFANSIGIIADGMTTFPYHIKGIDFAGRPLVQFEELLSEIPQVNYWLPEEPALRLSRSIEQSQYDKRRLRDGITYSETLTAALSLALKYPGKKGLQQVQILVGHTHWPQSRPHLYLGMLNVPHLDKQVPVRLPTQYYNSGTCGWWEGVLWGVEVTDFGQPKLFYWEKNMNAPHYMPWELHGEIPEQVVRFKEKAKKFLEKCLNPSVLNEQTRNLAAWEQIDDFSDLNQIDLSTLDAGQQAAALNTASIWALRNLENRPRTSPCLEIAVDLKSMVAPQSPSPRYSLVSHILTHPYLIAAALKSFGIGESWVALNSQNELYYQVGTLFFFAAHVLRNSLCNQLGLLLNMFISREREFMVRFDQARQLFALKLGSPSTVIASPTAFERDEAIPPLRDRHAPRQKKSGRSR